MAFNKETLGLRIGEIRRRRGLSQMALAEQIEKAPTFISSIETGQRGMSLETFVSIVNALNVPADALLIDSIKNSEQISNSFFAAVTFDCTEFERHILLGQYRTTATIRITGRPFCKNQLGRPCFCSQERTDSSCQAGSVSQNQIR